MKCFPRMINNSIPFLVLFDVRVLFTINLEQVKHILLMHFETVKLADCSVPPAAKTDARGIQSIQSDYDLRRLRGIIFKHSVS